MALKSLTNPSRVYMGHRSRPVQIRFVVCVCSILSCPMFDKLNRSIRQALESARIFFQPEKDGIRAFIDIFGYPLFTKSKVRVV